MHANKTPAYIGLLMFFLLFSLVARDSSLAVLALPVLVFLFLSSLLQPRGAIAFSAHRQLDPATLASMRPVRVELTIKNLSRNPLRYLEIEDQLPPGLTVQSGTNKTTANLGPGGIYKLEYHVSPPPRGLHRIGPVRIILSDPLKLFPSETSVGSPDSLYVYPERHTVRVRINPRRTGSWWGSTPSRRAGVGMEFYGIRDYQPGDELRNINWKATARLARIVTNEFETERASDVVLLIDAGRLAGSLIDSKSILDYEIEAGLSIASFLLNNGNRVGLILHGKYRHWIYPGFGGRQHLKLRDQLMLAKEGDSEIPLRFLVSQLAPMILSEGSQVIIIGHRFSLDLPEAVVNLQSLGYHVATVLIQPYRGRKDVETPSNLARRIVLMKMEETAANVERLCPTTDWRVDEPLDYVMRRLSIWIRRPYLLAQ